MRFGALNLAELVDSWAHVVPVRIEQLIAARITGCQAWIIIRLPFMGYGLEWSVTIPIQTAPA